MEKLNGPNGSKSSATKIFTMSKWGSLEFIKRSENLAKHINCMAALVEQLASMKGKLNDALFSATKEATIQVPALQPVTVASISTFAEYELT